MEEPNTFQQQHHISEEEIIKVAALHLRGKAHAWWKLESISFENVKASSYVSFTKSLVKGLDQNILGNHDKELNQGTQTKPLHRNAIPPQETIGGAKNLHQALLEAKLPSHTFEQKKKELSFPKVDQIIGMFPNFIAEIEGNSAAKSK